MTEVAELVRAATVLLLRDTRRGMESLLLRRNSKLGFGGGMWVFPGGRVDPADDHPDEEIAARNAAVREAREEAGLEVDPAELVAFAHWTPPPVGNMRRFSTWFFLAQAPPGEIEIDNGEIVDHIWSTPAEALRRHAAGEVEMLPPTFQSLTVLGEAASVADALAAARARALPTFVTRIVMSDAGAVAMWEGDAGYEAGDTGVPGARHRLHMGALPWRYERT